MRHVAHGLRARSLRSTAAGLLGTTLGIATALAIWEYVPPPGGLSRDEAVRAAAKQGPYLGGYLAEARVTRCRDAPVGYPRPGCDGKWVWFIRWHDVPGCPIPGRPTPRGFATAVIDRDTGRLLGGYNNVMCGTLGI